MSDWSNEYAVLIEDCEKREGQMTDWERSFIDSLKSQLAAGTRPTPKQV